MIHPPRSHGSSSAYRPALPVHFFTIVLNGEPFIRYHIEKFSTLPFEWHWHIIEGVAALRKDTAWSVAHGGHISPELHRDGLSSDGTSEYLDELALLHPDRVTIYRKSGGNFWDGKLEMINAPLVSLKEECLLWQIDADELWTPEQIMLVRRLFMAHPKKSAAYFYCNFFVGERLVVTGRGSYGNNTDYEWLRCWRFAPGCCWHSHEPPRLCVEKDGTWVDLATIDPLSHANAETYGLRFQHFAYVTEEQLRFKEAYYGYRDALKHWKSLQRHPSFPTALEKFFPWVFCHTIVDTASARKVEPLAFRNNSGNWSFVDCRDITPLPSYNGFVIQMRRIWFTLINAGRVANKISEATKPIFLAGESLRKNDFFLNCWRLYLLFRDRLTRLTVRRRPSGNKVLVVKLDAIGDFVIWLDSAKEYRRLFPSPQWELYLLGNQAWTSLAEEVHLFDEVWSLDRGRFFWQPCYRSRLIGRIRRAGFFRVITPTYSREFLFGDAIIGTCGAEERIGSQGNYSNILPMIKRLSDRWYTRLIPTSPANRTEYERNADFVRGLGSEGFRAAISRLPPCELPSEFTLSQYFVVFPGANVSGRRWPPGRFLELAGRIHVQTGWPCVVCGGPEDRQLWEKLLVNSHVPIFNWAGKTSLPQLVAIISRASLLVGNESGAIHIAAAVSTPSVCIAGGGHFGRFVPYNMKEAESEPKIVAEKMACFQCNWHCQHEVKDGVPFPCIQRVTVDLVWGEVSKLLADRNEDSDCLEMTYLAFAPSSEEEKAR